jgi:hypothetical protein
MSPIAWSDRTSYAAFESAAVAVVAVENFVSLQTEIHENYLRAVAPHEDLCTVARVPVAASDVKLEMYRVPWMYL